jgi:hypothetical protein
MSNLQFPPSPETSTLQPLKDIPSGIHVFIRNPTQIKTAAGAKYRPKKHCVRFLLFFFVLS